MRFGWLSALGHSLSILTRPTQSARRQIADFGIGFCPGCRRLRGVASLQCRDCSSQAPVTEDA